MSKIRWSAAVAVGAGLFAGCVGGDDPGASDAGAEAAFAAPALESTAVAGEGGVAAEGCPGASSFPGVVGWEAHHTGKAVTLCHGLDGAGKVAVHVQIVDFEAGAKMRVMSEVAPGETAGQPVTHFNLRTAQGWFTWVQGNVSVPSSQTLFSVTNGSFFLFAADESRAHLRRMAFPQKKWNALTSSGGELDCQGTVGAPLKRSFGLSDPHLAGRQFPYVKDYGDPCRSTPAGAAGELASYFDATVGYHPLGAYQDNDPVQRRRTFIGTRSTDGAWTGTQDRAYLLTSAVDLTRDEARDILINDFHTMYNVQLDGGSGTQYFSAAGRLDSDNFPEPLPRTVPEVLVVYDAP